jgi:hypothetical protein
MQGDQAISRLAAMRREERQPLQRRSQGQAVPRYVDGRGETGLQGEVNGNGAFLPQGGESAPAPGPVKAWVRKLGHFRNFLSAPTSANNGEFFPPPGTGDAFSSARKRSGGGNGVAKGAPPEAVRHESGGGCEGLSIASAPCPGGVRKRSRDANNFRWGKKVLVK